MVHRRTADATLSAPTKRSGDMSRSREAEIGRLYARLTDGYQRIDDAIANGQDVTAWEEFWIELLHQYEALCDEAEGDLAKAS